MVYINAGFGRFNWRTGMVLESPDKTAKASINVDHEERCLKIALEGPGAKNYLTSLRETLAKIHHGFKELGEQEIVIAHVGEDAQGQALYHHIPYRDLLSLVKMKAPLVIPQYEMTINDPSTLLGNIENKPLRQPTRANSNHDQPNTETNPTSEETTPIVRDTIFICYSRKNVAVFNQVNTMLKGLGHQAPVQPWSDEAIMGGERWKLEIERAIQRTKVAILLVSQPFMASDFIQNKELPEFIALEKEQELTIIPLFIQTIPGAKHIKAIASPGVNAPDKTWKAMTELERDNALADLGERVLAIFENG